MSPYVAALLLDAESYQRWVLAKSGLRPVGGGERARWLAVGYVAWREHRERVPLVLDIIGALDRAAGRGDAP